MSRWLKIPLMALAALGALLLTLPWWLGLALRPVLQSQGITFEAYERAGYAHFLLRNVNHQAARFRLDAAQVKSVTPLLWLARRLRGQEPALAVENWSARLIPAPPAAGTKSAPNATPRCSPMSTRASHPPPPCRRGGAPQWVPGRAGQIRPAPLPHRHRARHRATAHPPLPPGGAPGRGRRCLPGGPGPRSPAPIPPRSEP